MEKISRIITLFFDVLFPRDTVSLFCDTLSPSALEKLVSYTVVPAVPDCVAFFPYAHPVVRNVIYAMKYHNHPRPERMFGDSLAPYIAEEISERRLFGSYHTSLVIPIPLHTKKLEERGYNQSEKIARALLQSIHDSSFTLQTKALVRIRYTRTQTKHADARSRFQNVRGAFAVSDTTLVRGKDIILIDDVVTTGATLLEAQKTLLTAGAKRVWCIAVAH